MARNHFEQLDEEQRALHDSWDNIARVVLLVIVTSTAIWALCSVTKYLVHLTADTLLGAVAKTSFWKGAAMLLGALLVGGIARGLLNRWEQWREVANDGIDPALSNYHCTYNDDEDDPTPRYERPAFGLAIRKAAATILTLGTGGSGGLEGPVVLMGESMGAGVARMMNSRSEHELRTYQLAGIAAAVGTLLNAPFASALFAIEVAYGDRIIYRKLAYALLGGTVAYVLNNHFLGFSPVFVAPPHSHVYSMAEYGVSALVAVAISAPTAFGFGMAMKHTRRLVSQVQPVARGAVGALLTGLVALALWAAADMDVRHVLGTGDWTLRLLLAKRPPAELAVWWFLVLAAIGRMLTAGFTQSSGGSAGLLFPSMFIGGVAGAATGRILSATGVFPQLDVAIFVVVGIASALVAMVGVPLSAIALVLEVFGSPYGPPAILACGVTYVLTLRQKVYENQARTPRPSIGEPLSDAEAEAPTQQHRTIPSP